MKSTMNIHHTRAGDVLIATLAVAVAGNLLAALISSTSSAADAAPGMQTPTRSLPTTIPAREIGAPAMSAYQRAAKP
jgi:hypothetical protein